MGITESGILLPRFLHTRNEGTAYRYIRALAANEEGYPKIQRAVLETGEV
jgi:hypothetical protein